MTPILEFEEFSYRHPGSEAPALREVNLSVGHGEFVVLAGPSGAGKSSLIRAACGLAPGFDGGTAAGRVRVAGLDTRDHKAAELARACGTVLQDPERQVVMGKVRAELALPLESRGLNELEVARGVEEVALLVGIEEILDRSLATLSGGELQRVATAAALACSPPLLLLDEPTSQLDPVAADDLVWLLRRLNEEQGIAVVVAEQRLERLLPAADRIVVLGEGRVACDSPPRAFLKWAAQASPALLTPGAAMFAQCGIADLPVSVKEAREQLCELGLAPNAEAAQAAPKAGPRNRLFARRPKGVIEVTSIWDERTRSRPLLAGIDLSVARGETVALMGRNGAGKSTLLKHIAGVLTPTRGAVSVDGEVALLTQNPGDHLIADRLGDLAGDDVLAAAGLRGGSDRNPRDLSGGERQRLAFELVAGTSGDLDSLLLDEPTRGLDRGRRAELAHRLRSISAGGTAVILATHDAELAAEVADRVLLLADGRVLADGAPAEVLAGGWHFTTETSRILAGAGRALLPAEGARLLGAGRQGVPK